MRDELKDRAISLLKDTYRQGYEDGVKATNVDCGVVWEERIEDIKSNILSYKDDKIIHAEQNEMIDIVLEIIDRHIGDNSTEEKKE